VLLVLGLSLVQTLVGAEEAVVVDDTNEKHHMPSASTKHHDLDAGHDENAEEGKNGPTYEFVAEPGLLLPAQSDLKATMALGRLVEWLKVETPFFAEISLDMQDGVSFLKAEGDYEGGKRLAGLPIFTMITTATPSEGMPDNTPYCDLTRRWDQGLLMRAFTKPEGTASDEEKRDHYIDSVRGSKVLVALCLIHELKKEGGSFYQPFLDTMPRSLSQPIVWSNEAIAELQSSPLVPAIQHARQQLHKDYRVLAQNLFTHPAQGFTEAQYNWAMLYVSQHMEEFRLPSRPRPVKALVPLVQFMQVDPVRGSLLTGTDGDLLDMVDITLSGFDYTAGEPLRIRKPHCFTSQCLLLNYGVLPEEENPYDHLPLVVVSGGEANYQSVVADYLGEDSLTPEVFAAKADLLVAGSATDVALASVDARLMTAFRTLAMTADELKQAQETVTDENPLIMYAGRKINDENEARASKILSEIVFNSLASYPTGILDDRQMLDELKNEEEEFKMAIRMRIREKELLLGVLQELQDEGLPLAHPARVMLIASRMS